MKNLFNDISQEEKNRILEMHSGRKPIIKETYSNKKSMIYEQEDMGNVSILYSCLGTDAEAMKEFHLSEIDELLDVLFEATNEFNWESDWDEEMLVSALELGDLQSVNDSQNALRCVMKKLNISIQDNNPLLTICRKAFTSFGHTDLGDDKNKNRAQSALLKLNIKTRI
jgi:hypothetical protein